jgi:ferredoxin
VRLDPERCTGHGRCYDLAPKVFAPDEAGHCRIRQAEVAPADERAAQLAVDNCPEDALAIDEH